MNEKATARTVIEKIAPEELPLFEDMWADAQTYGSTNADTREKKLGMGGIAEIHLLSSIIIPTITALASKFLANRAEDIYKYIKDQLAKRRENLEDKKLRAIAEEISKAAEDNKS